MVTWYADRLDEANRAFFHTMDTGDDDNGVHERLKLLQVSYRGIWKYAKSISVEMLEGADIGKAIVKNQTSDKFTFASSCNK
jgi:hypothetical protein